jgi:hypothetical protein
MEPSDKIQQAIDRRASWIRQRDLLRDQLESNLLMSYNGSMFKIDPVLISFCHTLISNNIKSTVLLDLNQLPCDIIDLDNFLSSAIEHYHTAVNIYSHDLAEYKKVKNLG